MPARQTQYTIRGVPADVDRALRQEAKEKHVSLNHFLVQQLARIAQESGGAGLCHDLDFAIGAMADGPLVDEALKEFSVVDEDLWK